MRDSLLILCVFLTGVALARMGAIPAAFNAGELALPALWIFMFLAGAAIGADERLRRIMRNASPTLLLLPVATTIGTFAGCAALFFVLPLFDCLAVGAGFGYYSLSSIFIGQYKGPDLGAVALLANICRELLAIILMPLLVARSGPLAAIASGGSPTVDTILPAIARYAGPAYILPAIAHGIALDLSVPFWVTLFCSL